jgi:hypothetical protein
MFIVHASSASEDDKKILKNQDETSAADARKSDRTLFQTRDTETNDFLFFGMGVD